MRISLKSIAKIGIITCLGYNMWYKWAFREINIVLYATVAIAAGCMLIDLLFINTNEKLVIPYGSVNDLIMCVYSLLTGFFLAISRYALLNSTKTYFSFVLVCITVYYASSEEGIDWMLKGLIAIAALCAIWTMLYGYYRPGYGMVLSKANNPHTLGLTMDIGLFALAYRSKFNIKSFSIHLVFALLFLYTIVNCGSRKCLIAATFIIIPWFVLSFREVSKSGKNIDKLFIICILLIFLLFGINYYHNGFTETASYERFENIENSEANKTRLNYYELGWEFLLESPAFGIGLGQFSIRNPLGGYSHSTIVEAFASWGLLGGLLYFLPI